MPGTVDPATLNGEWLSYHEDPRSSADTTVFRRAGAPLPRARGRNVITLNPDQTAT